MDAISSVLASISGLTASQAVSPVASSRAAAIDPTTLFGQSSTLVALSGASQVFSTAALFQDQMAALQPGANGIGQNFGNDVTSFAVEAQFLVDAFNGARAQLAGLGSGTSLEFVQALSDTAQARFDNGDSTLTRLAQIGIDFQPTVSGGGGLAIDLGTLQSAFASDPAGAFSLLTQASQALNGVAAETVGQGQSGFDLLSALTQLGITGQFFGTASSAASGSDLSSLMLSVFLGGIDSGANGDTLQNLLALNELNQVSTLLG